MVRTRWCVPGSRLKVHHKWMGVLPTIRHRRPTQDQSTTYPDPHPACRTTRDLNPKRSVYHSTPNPTSFLTRYPPTRVLYTTHPDLHPACRTTPTLNPSPKKHSRCRSTQLATYSLMWVPPSKVYYPACNRAYRHGWIHRPRYPQQLNLGRRRNQECKGYPGIQQHGWIRGLLRGFFRGILRVYPLAAYHPGTHPVSHPVFHLACQHRTLTTLPLQALIEAQYTPSIQHTRCTPYTHFTLLIVVV